MAQTAALFFRKDGFDTGGKRLLGRQAAGEGFLRALVRHGRSDDLFCYAPTRGDFQEFCKLVKPVGRPNQKAHWLEEHNPPQLARAGALFRPDAMINELAFQRRSIDPRAYSICGITHTIASRAPQRSIAELLTAPVERWDALVCTSQSVRRTVQQILDGYGEYLAERCGGRPELELKLPVIPLGVDVNGMLQGEAAEAARARLRGKLELGTDDVVMLFMGRLVFYAKAHPVPLYLAAERAAKRSDKRLVLLLAGWFESPQEEAEFKALAAKLCPSVRTVFVDGREAEMRRDVWPASDIFVSLSDNIQETFGLTPIEAMAAGLPVIVADWDGYRESVREGIEGLRIDTLLPPAGAARDLASFFGVETMSYSDYIANVSMATAVDVTACENAIVRLAGDANLRKQLGENGRQRARTTYDWSVVVREYEALWSELAELRAAGPARFAPKEKTRNPLVPDPFELYGHYPTRAIVAADRVLLGVGHELFESLSESTMTRYGSNYRSPPELCAGLVQTLRAGETPTVAQILESHPSEPRQALLRSLGHLAKFDIIQLSRGGGK
jgi:glycosyltransferase involved in cell wall biosynthesis